MIAFSIQPASPTAPDRVAESGDLVLNPIPAQDTPKLSLLDAVKLTIPQAAKLIGIGETKMRSIVQGGGIPVLRIEGKTVIVERDIEAFLQGHYGSMQPAPKWTPKSKLTALPKAVNESPWLRKNGTEP